MVSIDQIHTLGREDDRKRREELCRKDDAERRKKVDDARKSLYNNGYAITGDHVDGLLKDESLVPTKVFASTFALFASLNVALQNAFSVALSPLGFDFHGMLTVDLLHEVELGVWKALLLHLIRMLNACGADQVHTFDERCGLLGVEPDYPCSPQTSFRLVPTFGDKIRRFDGNISEMKRLAGHDLEDTLQARNPMVLRILC